MTWPEVILAIANMAQFVLLVWLSARQQQVKTELSRVNGHLEQSITALDERVRALQGSAPARDALKPFPRDPSA